MQSVGDVDEDEDEAEGREDKRRRALCFFVRALRSPALLTARDGASLGIGRAQRHFADLVLQALGGGVTPSSVFGVSLCLCLSVARRRPWVIGLGSSPRAVYSRVSSALLTVSASPILFTPRPASQHAHLPLPWARAPGHKQGRRRHLRARKHAA